jgi:hypothetical protein
VPEYRFYSLKSGGHIAGPPVDLELPDDASAIAEAKQRLDRYAIEIWQGTRVVGHLDPKTS